MRLKILILLWVIAVSVDAVPLSREVVMGFNPAENAQTVESNSKKFAQYYKKRTGYSIRTFIATDYTALIEALRSGRIDFAWLPPFSLIKAEELASAKVLLKSVRRGHAFLYSAIFSRADKNISSLKDLKGKNMAWVDPSSASGHIFPKASLLTDHADIVGTNLDKFFGRQVFAGSHDAVVLAVFNGTVDAGATFCNDKSATDCSWHLYLKGEDAKKMTLVFLSKPFGNDTISTSSQFQTTYPEVVAKTVELLQAMGRDPEGAPILKELYRIDSMVPAIPEDYRSVREAAKVLKLISKE